jgi:hypothetical protein
MCPIVFDQYHLAAVFAVFADGHEETSGLMPRDLAAMLAEGVFNSDAEIVQAGVALPNPFSLN